MKAIKDQAYLFSLANYNSGTILSCRALNGESVIGKRFEDVVGIAAEESNFFYENQKQGSENIFLLSEKDGIQRAVVILRFFSYTALMAVGILLDFPAVSIATLLKQGAIESAIASPALLSLANEKDENYQLENEVYDYLNEMLGELSSLYFMKLQGEKPNHVKVMSAVKSTAKFVGIQLEMDSFDAEKEKYGSEVGNVYAGPFFCAAMFVITMSARMFARDRSFKAIIEWGNFGYSLSFSFVPTVNCDMTAIDFLKELALSSQIGMVFSQNENEIKGEFSPFYFDVGMSGVKEMGRSLSRTEIDILRYDYKY